MVSKPVGQIIQPLYQGIRIDAQLFGHFPPMMKADVAQTVFAAEFHRQFNLLNVDIRVGQDARHIVKGRQTDLCFCTDEQ